MGRASCQAFSPASAPSPARSTGAPHLGPDFDAIERAYDDSKYGRSSERPILECTIASVVDPTAPPAKHLMSVFVQYAPYALREGTWDRRREGVADRCFDLLDEYAPNFRRAVLLYLCGSAAHPGAVSGRLTPACLQR